MCVRFEPDLTVVLHELSSPRPSFYFGLRQVNPTIFFTRNLIHFYHNNVMIERIAIAYF